VGIAHVLLLRRKRKVSTSTTTAPATKESVKSRTLAKKHSKKCFADLLKGLIFDDEVMDWVVDALHQSHADQKQFTEESIARLRLEQSRLQNRLDKLYEDRLDGFIEPAFFERKTQEWRQSQARIVDQIAQYKGANQEYFKDGVRLLELSKKAYFSIQETKFARKAQIAEFRLFELDLERSVSHRKRSASRLTPLPLRIPPGKDKRSLELLPATFVLSGSAGRTHTRLTLL